MRCAALMAVALTLTVPAQAEPYQSDLRSVFDRDISRGELKPGFFVAPRIESALQLVGNINLSPDPAREVDLAGIEVAPGIYASYNTSRGRGFLDYSLIGRLWEESDYNALSHRLTASGNYYFVPDWFYVAGRASYGDAVINPLRSYNYGRSGLFNRSNIDERATASVSPTINHNFRDFNLLARYTYGRVWYLDNKDTPTDPIFSSFRDDSRDQRALVQVSSRDPQRQSTLKVFYEWQASDFETTVPYRYERLGTDLGFRLTREFRLVGDAGLESDLDKSTVAGGLDSTYWHVGLRWQPDSRTSLDARFGERFYGDSWRAVLSRDTRWATFRVSYVEDPDVETRRVGINFDPEEIPPPEVGDPSGLTSYPYLKKDAVASAIVEGAKTRLRLDIFSQQRDYFTNLRADTDVQGVRFNGKRDFGSYIYAELDGRYSDAKRGIVDDNTLEVLYSRSYDWVLKGRLNWELYKNFLASVELGYLQRTGNLDYNGQWLALRFRYTMRSSEPGS